MASHIVSFQLEEDLLAQLDALAEATDRDRLYHVKRAWLNILGPNPGASKRLESASPLRMQAS